MMLQHMLGACCMHFMSPLCTCLRPFGLRSHCRSATASLCVQTCCLADSLCSMEARYLGDLLFDPLPSVLLLLQPCKRARRHLPQHHAQMCDFVTSCSHRSHAVAAHAGACCMQLMLPLCPCLCSFAPVPIAGRRQPHCARWRPAWPP